MEHEFDASISETKRETEMMEIKTNKQNKSTNNYKKVNILFLMANSKYINFLFFFFFLS